MYTPTFIHISDKTLVRLGYKPREKALIKSKVLDKPEEKPKESKVKVAEKKKVREKVDFWVGRRAGVKYRGEKVNTAKLTARKVLEIRGDKRPVKEIAKEYGVSLNTIYDIKKRKTWKSVYIDKRGGKRDETKD